MEPLDFKQIEAELRNHLSDPVLALEGKFHFEYLDEENSTILELWGDKAGQVLIMNNETGETKVVPLAKIGELSRADLPGESGVEAEDPDSGPGPA